MLNTFFHLHYSFRNFWDRTHILNLVAWRNPYTPLFKMFMDAAMHELQHNFQSSLNLYCNQEVTALQYCCLLWGSYRKHLITSPVLIIWRKSGSLSWVHNWSSCNCHIVSASAFLVYCVSKCVASSYLYWGFCGNYQSKFWLSSIISTACWWCECIVSCICLTLSSLHSVTSHLLCVLFLLIHNNP